MLKWKSLKVNLKTIKDYNLDSEKSVQFYGPSEFCTTFFACVNNLYDKYEGQILWHDQDIRALSHEEELEFRRHVSLVFSWGGLLSNQSLEENILLPLQYHGKDTAPVKKIILDFYKKNRYYHFLHERPFYVPLNLRKLTAILRALLFAESYIFIEDICLGLEKHDIVSLQEFIEDLGKAVYFYDSLAKFKLRNTDSFILMPNKKEVSA